MLKIVLIVACALQGLQAKPQGLFSRPQTLLSNIVNPQPEVSILPFNPQSVLGQLNPSDFTAQLQAQVGDISTLVDPAVIAAQLQAQVGDISALVDPAVIAAQLQAQVGDISALVDPAVIAAQLQGNLGGLGNLDLSALQQLPAQLQAQAGQIFDPTVFSQIIEQIRQNVDFTKQFQNIVDAASDITNGDTQEINFSQFLQAPREFFSKIFSQITPSCPRETIERFVGCLRNFFSGIFHFQQLTNPLSLEKMQQCVTDRQPEIDTLVEYFLGELDSIYDQSQGQPEVLAHLDEIEKLVQTGRVQVTEAIQQSSPTAVVGLIYGNLPQLLARLGSIEVILNESNGPDGTLRNRVEELRQFAATKAQDVVSNLAQCSLSFP